MAEEEKNVKIDETEKTVTITLNPRLYPQSVIMRAAYRFIEDFDVLVDGDPLETITAVFNVREEDKKGATKKDLESISSTFQNELLHASVEETQARRYADTRNALIGAAVRQLIPMNVDPRAIADTLKSYATENESVQASNSIEGCCTPVDKECKKTAFDLVYHYMPKQNCGRCGRNCEETARKIAAGECDADACFHLKTTEFSVVRKELEKVISCLKTGKKDSDEKKQPNKSGQQDISS